MGVLGTVQMVTGTRTGGYWAQYRCWDQYGGAGSFMGAGPPLGGVSGTNPGGLLGPVWVLGAVQGRLGPVWGGHWAQFGGGAGTEPSLGRELGPVWGGRRGLGPVWGWGGH